MNPHQKHFILCFSLRLIRKLYICGSYQSIINGSDIGTFLSTFDAFIELTFSKGFKNM